MMKKIILIFFVGLIACNAQNYSDKDIEIVKKKFDQAEREHLSSKPINEIIVAVGKSFIGTNYKGFVLDGKGEERLVVNLRELDCTTFLENVLAISRCIKKHKTKFKDFVGELRTIRYRNGVINQYTSRLHYFTDWIYDNEMKGIVRDVTKNTGGVQYKLKLNFMSSHPELYAKLKENPGLIPVIKKQEKDIGDREHYYIPKRVVGQAEAEIKNGDLIAFTSNVEGLDVNHVGIAVRLEDNHIYILHAPEEGSKIQITKSPLTEYINKLKKDTGIIVFKAANP